MEPQNPEYKDYAENRKELGLHVGDGEREARQGMRGFWGSRLRRWKKLQSLDEGSEIFFHSLFKLSRHEEDACKA